MTRKLDDRSQFALVAAERKCMAGTPRRFCGYPAVVHVMQTDGSYSMHCKTHAAWWTHHPYQDIHPIDGACGLPDTAWVMSTDPTHPGRCIIDGLSHIPDLFAEPCAVRP